MDAGTLAVFAYNCDNFDDGLYFYLKGDMLYCERLTDKGIVALICDRKIGYALENGECMVYDYEDEHQDWKYVFTEELLPILENKEIICYDTATALKYGLNVGKAFDNPEKRVRAKK